MKTDTQIKTMEPFDMQGFTESFVSGVQQNNIEIQYFKDPNDNQSFYARVQFLRGAQGKPGIVHGGAIAAVFDECMGALTLINNQAAFTASLKIDYISPLPVESLFYVESHLQKTERRKIFITGQLFDENQKLYAQAEGLYVIPKNEVE
ncbi:MAG: PaaI family thioesterase [Bacteroidales bacterium]|nr:PaaI family thioesterase [Bacteroidales bacterium]